MTDPACGWHTCEDQSACFSLASPLSLRCDPEKAATLEVEWSLLEEPAARLQGDFSSWLPPFDTLELAIVNIAARLRTHAFDGHVRSAKYVSAGSKWVGKTGNISAAHKWQEGQLPEFLVVYSAMVPEIWPFLQRGGYRLLKAVWHSHLGDTRFIYVFELT